VSDLILKSLDINNFRSIRGQIHAPLDAKVVLIHGENGAGKTSLLSAVELALTGKVQSLERADPNYEKQLLHRLANEGSVLLRTLAGTSEQNFRAVLNAAGAQSIDALDERRATFFRERAFLPQSLLGQLLQIYQDAANDSASPLAQFVGKLLGLDRLDALEAGLKPLADVRNIRKNVDGWPAAENEKSRLDRLLSDQRKVRDALNGQIRNTLSELATLCRALELQVEVREEALDEVAAAISGGSDSEAFARLADQQRRLASIRREIDAAQSATGSSAALTPAGADEASRAFARWEAEFGERVSGFRRRVEGLLPDVSLPSDPEQFAEAALRRLRTEQKQLSDRASQARADIARHAAAQDERDVALRQRGTIDEEVARMSSSAGTLGSTLAELTSFIADEMCPVCDRNFREVSKVPLSEHIHDKVRTLSASAERLLTLGRTRSEMQVTIERLDREIESIAAHRLEEEALADLDRRQASGEVLINELETVTDALRLGGRLRAANVVALRAVSEAQSRHVSLAAARDTLNDFALSICAHFWRPKRLASRSGFRRDVMAPNISLPSARRSRADRKPTRGFRRILCPGNAPTNPSSGRKRYEIRATRSEAQSTEFGPPSFARSLMTGSIACGAICSCGWRRASRSCRHSGSRNRPRRNYSPSSSPSIGTVVKPAERRAQC
jgi:DNA repair protein SbcC/Rad50